MADDRENSLPVHGQETGDAGAEAAPECGPNVYVTNEEVAILAAIRALREEAVGVRERLARCTDPAERTTLSSALEALRARREELSHRREHAFRRKMIMLGHLPPDAAPED